MRAGLSGHHEVCNISFSVIRNSQNLINILQKLKDATPYVVQADDRESNYSTGGRGGRGVRGRGNGFAARGLAMAGLTRQQPEKRQFAGEGGSAEATPAKAEAEPK